ncbi:HNH endonuclease [Pedobacter endophyticus]|uniref:HNH endonuclease 5 domain-containing protein n=1 Tax=Pedobacter endophyticus TaxID=2789740 RepID=A0A7U3Q3U1_9SPHI|nr:HNH endonuclease [Pedobacter endophyticus]QPH37859.1 hypothetical protein IZT61_12130 [Pedobacter endophyticus]
MKRDFCIFCKSPLDGSDEHIIPQSVNGKLHSKDLICHDCNSNFFGRKIDPVIKKTLEPIINLLCWNNSRQMVSEDINGRQYLTKDGQSKPVKPIKTEEFVDTKKVIRISGDVENTIKMFQKEVGRLKSEGQALAEYSISMPQNTTPFLRTPFTIDLSPELILLMNKIACEFYVHSQLDYQPVEALCSRVRHADNGLGNVIFCNQKNEIRDHASSEVSHLIHLQNDKETKQIFAYIEIFNVLCCVVILTNNYHGDDISFTYHQDAMTSERFSNHVNLKMSLAEILAYPFESSGFGYLLNSMMFNLRDREFNEVVKDEFNKIKRLLGEQELTVEEHDEKWIQQTTKLIAELTVFDFPYILEDQEDEENDEYNYVHSNFREAIVDQFTNEHHFLLGKLIKTKHATFTVRDFFLQPIIVKKNKQLITIFVVLENNQTKDKSYVKVADFISSINKALEQISIKRSNK